MELTTLFKRVVGLAVHQAKITACAITEDDGGNVGVELVEFGGFKHDRKALAQWVAGHRPEAVVMEITSIYWKHLLEESLRGAGGCGYCRDRGECRACEHGPRSQDGLGGRAVAGDAGTYRDAERLVCAASAIAGLASRGTAAAELGRHLRQ